MSNTSEDLAQKIKHLKSQNSDAMHGIRMRNLDLKILENRLANETAQLWIVVAYKNNETQNRTISIVCGASLECESHVEGCTFKLIPSKSDHKKVQLTLREFPTMLELTLTCDHEQEFILRDSDSNATCYTIRLFETLIAATAWRDDHVDRS